MQRIIDYDIIQVIDDLPKFIEEVKEAIKKGWQPYGPAAHHNQEYTDFSNQKMFLEYHSQVMVKYETRPEQS